MTPFLVLSTQRSGSTWMIDSLNTHPRVKAYGELFAQGGRGRPPRGAQDLVFWETWQQREKACSSLPDLVHRYLDTVFRQDKGLDAVGFKLMYGQAGANPEILDYLASRRAAVVHLRRTNLLNIILSKEATVVRGKFSVNRGEEVESIQIELRPNQLIARLEEQERELEKGRRILRRLPGQCLEVRYEDLITGRIAFSDVLRFLDVGEPEHDLSSKMQRLNTVGLPQLIANYAEVERRLATTRFSRFLKEPN